MVSGFWHGANWTFVTWGGFHALLFLPLIVLGKNRKNTNTVAEGRILPSLKECTQMLLTFALVVIGWIFFRADSIADAMKYMEGMLQFGTFRAFYRILLMKEFLLIVPLVLIEWLQRDKQHGLEQLPINYRWLRWLFYFGLVIAIYLLQPEQEQQFIYFQF